MPSLPPATVEVGEATPGCSRARRTWRHPEYLTERPVEGVNVVSDILSYCAKTYGTKDAFGWRDVVTIHEEVKSITKVVNGKEVKEDKTWQYYELSDFKYISFVEMSEMVQDVANGLIELGLGVGDVFNIYASTRFVFVFLSLATPCRRELTCGCLSVFIGDSYSSHAC